MATKKPDKKSTPTKSSKDKNPTKSNKSTPAKKK